MALITCPECGKEISDKSPACIHCGFPLSVKNVDIVPFQKELVKLFNKYNVSFIAYNKDGGKYPPSISGIVNRIKEHISLIDKNDNDMYSKYIVSMYKSFLLLTHMNEMVIKNIHGVIDASRLSEDAQFEIMSAYKKYAVGKAPIWRRYFYPLFREFYSQNGNKNHFKYQNLFGNEFEDFLNVMNKSAAKKEENIPKYPTCQSTNIKKISGISKAGSVAFWGVLAAGKVSKQWHCNNCGSEW